VKYSGDARTIRVGVRRRGAEVAISVGDGGIGIPREEKGRIFERFHRVGTSLIHDVRLGAIPLFHSGIEAEEIGDRLLNTVRRIE
jgi:K+-sensing histidine kinase KdpD